MKPHRVRLSRAKGWRMPPNTVSVARPTKWGNPYKAGTDYYGVRPTMAEVVQAYRLMIESEPETISDTKRELRGKNLACWCPIDRPCHADVLLEIANR